MAQMKTLTVGNSTYTVTDAEAVSFQQAQQLSPQQQEQARKNIGVWSGQSILDRLCPVFTQEGSVAVCTPVTGDLLQVTSQLEQKNLFCCDEDKSYEYNGVSVVKKQGESSVTLSGTAAGDSSITLCQALLLKAGTYTVSLYGANVLDRYNDRIYLQYINTAGKDIYVNSITADYPATFTLDAQTAITVYLVLAAGSAYSNRTVSVQIEAGSAVTAYVPHRLFDRVELTRCGKNLFHTDSSFNGTVGGLRIIRNPGQSFVFLNGTSQAAQDYSVGENIFVKAGTYTASVFGANLLDVDFDRIFVRYTGANGETVYVNNIQTGKPKTFTVNADTVLSVRMVVGEGSTYTNARICVQIEAGSQSTDYAPYEGDTFVAELYAQTPVDGGTFCWDTGILTDSAGAVSQYPVQQIPAVAGENWLYSTTGATQVTGRVDATAVFEDLFQRLAVLEAAAVKNA